MRASGTSQRRFLTAAVVLTLALAPCAARADDTSWIVTGGLHDGDRIVVDGLQQAEPGTKVQPHAAAPTTASAR